VNGDQEFALLDSKVTIGRRKECDICLSGQHQFLTVFPTWRSCCLCSATVCRLFSIAVCRIPHVLLLVFASFRSVLPLHR
jgi:hypothetical protein